MKNFQLFLFLFLPLLWFSSCQQDDEMIVDPGTPSIPTTFDEVVDLGGGCPDPIEEQRVDNSGVYTEERDGVKWECTTETQSIQKGAGGNDGFPLFSPNASVIYPGNMLQGSSLNAASPKIIAVGRAGGVISTDVVDGNIVASFEVNSISKGEVSTAINNIIAGSTGVVPANFSLSIRNVQSREQFALELGVDVNTAFVDLESKLNFSSDKSYNRFVVNLNQSFYTMSFDIPTSLDQLFAPSVTPEDLEKYVGPNNPATYISDVTYGRIYYMLIESTSSTTEMNAPINGSFNGVATKVDAEVEVDYLSTLNDLKIQVFAYGGLASSSLLTAGKTNLNDLTTLLAESSNIGSGKPISYVVRSVYDNQIVSTQLATQYDVTECKPTGADGAPPYTEHWTGNVVSKMGPIGAAYNTYGNEFVLISKDGDQYMISNTGQLDGPYDIDQLGNTSCPFDGLGAACNIEGNANGDFYLQAFDKSGTNYAYMNPDGKWGNIHPISELALGTGPFNLVGIGAVGFRHKDSQGPASRYMFNREGLKYSAYLNNPNSFGNVYNTWQWGPDYILPFEKIGAAIGFFIGNDLFYILFNDAGTKYTLYGNVYGDGVTNILGPFDL